MILGHAASNSNAAYGDRELPVMLREIEKIPPYQGKELPPFVGE